MKVSIHILISIVLSSCCSWTYSCDCPSDEAGKFGLEGENLEWAHYEKDETSTFRNELDEVGHLHIVDKTDIIHLGDRGDECTPDEYDAFRYSIHFQDSFLLNTEIGGSGELIFGSESRQWFDCNIDGKLCDNFNGDNFSGEFYEMREIGGRQYENVFRLNIGGYLQDLFWTKEDGIVSFEFEGSKWDLVR